MSMDDQKKEKLVKELQGMALGTVGTFILLAFLTFNGADVSWNSYSNEGGINNLGGRLGAQVADLFFSGFGLASYLIPLALLYMAYTLFRFKEIRLRSYKLLASLGLIFSLSTRVTRIPVSAAMERPGSSQSSSAGRRRATSAQIAAA